MGRRRNKAPREFAAEITDLSHDGRGVTRIDGKVWFVDGALPGEQVRFKEQRGRKKFASGRVLELLTESPERISPRCQYFGTCGGCATQHLDHGAQIKAKQDQLTGNLEKIGRVKPAVLFAPLVGNPWGYRRRARLGARLVPKKGGMLVGFRERHSSFITPLDECHVLRPEAAGLLPHLPNLISGLSSPTRIPQVEVSVGDNETVLVFRHLEPLGDTDRMSLSSFGSRHGVQIWLQPGGMDSIHCIWPEDPGPLEYAMKDYGLVIRFEPTDFIQVNGEMNERLVARAIELLEPQPDERILDLFCGIGNFTLPLATRSESILGIEGDDKLVQRARENATRNKLDNAEFCAANLYDDAFDFGALAGPFDKILVDPPRSGAMEVVKQLGHERIKRIVYVSCNPSTLARDSQVLVGVHGYSLSGAGVADMFPHTAHVESIAVFDRN